MQIWCFPSRIIVIQVKSLNRVRLFVTPWTVVYQAPPSMGFSCFTRSENSVKQILPLSIELSGYPEINFKKGNHKLFFF